MSVAEPFSVLTWNILGGRTDGEFSFEMRTPAIQATLACFEPDLFGFQEVVKENLPALHLAYPRCTFLKGYDITPFWENPEFLTIGSRPSRFVRVDSGTHWLSKTPHVFSTYRGARHMRSFTWVMFHDLQTLMPLLFVNTHFDHIGRYAREQSAKQIVDFLETCVPELPVILVGDINCGPMPRSKRRPYEILLGAGLTDSYRYINPQWPVPYTYHGFLGERYRHNPDKFGTWMIDFIFVRNLCPIDSQIVQYPEGEIPPSDHYPVYSMLKYLD
jgi:endonuclease/exonuclease/phosphatase family metal-dependent hydrolase